ncbi:MAG TPA: threonine/serine dehydratase [Bryobacteraceae bacterium]|nr:threonine/serine dehydratase [Bryobacteraceae bacterium]
MITLDDVKAARDRIAGRVKRTELVSSEAVSARVGCPVYLKLEMFQKTGAFKVRGAFNKVLSIPENKRGRGLVAVSGGNHAQAVAYVGKQLGLRSVIFMPEKTPRNYLDATRGYGAEVILVPNAHEAFQQVAGYEAEGWTSVHPFDDPLVMAGQGTIGLEIVDDLPGVTDVVVSIGGGGFIGGIATAVKALRPQARMWGVETEGADSMTQAIAAGKPVLLTQITSIARTLGAPSVSEQTLLMAKKYLESVTLVPDVEAARALRFLLERAKVLTEPAASCTLAAAERLRDRFSPSSQVVLVLCGGNTSVADVCSYPV